MQASPENVMVGLGWRLGIVFLEVASRVPQRSMGRSLTHFIGPAPKSKDRQPQYKLEETRQKVKKKLSKVIGRGYIKLVPESVLKSLMYMFDVPKARMTFGWSTTDPRVD